MKKDFCELSKEHRATFLRLADGKKLITDPLGYRRTEEALLLWSKEESKGVKKRIIAECKEKGWSIPDFKLEGKPI